jgi:hypothetical protein
MNLLLLDDKNAAAAVVVVGVALQRLTTAKSFSAPLADISLRT